MVVLLNTRHRFVLLLLATFSCFSLRLCFGEDRITSTTPIRDSETLLCKSGVFRFGFFTPVNSTTRLRYVGIWYDKMPIQTVVWVANKDAPINDTSGVVSISSNGNLVVTDGRNRTLWSTNVTAPPAPTTTWVQLMDTGNLMLQDNRNNGETLWESFKHPYNSFLPKMTLGTDSKTGENLKLTSWRSYEDPSTGNYTAGLAPYTFPELLIWKNDVPVWRSGPWNGQVFIGLPDVDSLLFLDGFNLNNDNQGTVSMSYANDSFMYHFNLDPDGAIYQRDWRTPLKDWRIGVRFPSTYCDTYGICGPYGSCSMRETPRCKCVKGFVPRNETEWSASNWRNGCVRRAPLLCERQRNASNGGGGGKGDGFLKLEKMKVPINAIQSLANEQSCPQQCTDNCSCTAYAYDRGIGCMLWSGSLVDLQSFVGSGIDLNIRLAHSELNTHSNRAIVITASVLGVAFVAAVCVLLACRRFRKRPEPKKDRSAEIMFKRMEELTSGNESASNQVKLKELPLFEFQVLATATDSFSLRNKLGQGGFGPVYKGKLPEGQEIAVKRLSRASGQGLEELMNEVVVISKLQHRNLVKLLGCCIEGEERQLVYEYMSKKSLDAYLFDPLKQKIIDWKTRLNIMEGICRGLLYLHRDSRLKIIHRDLKASNILLDDNLNPKISDFGLARVFRANEDEANTRRVVGTYGYMSPEYAMEGLFSEKSDVFSLGVILLEIISGRRNSHKEENNLNLLAYAWKLWNEGEAASLADPNVFDESFEKEITKCVQIGLLCVQEVANDRPNVSTVICMLTTENTNLKEPKQPAIIARRGTSEAESSDQSSQKVSINDSLQLGQGGFGPVYKGKLPEGQEIAVKRLSRASGQGLEELMNEVVVISKLQHRNLVKLLGCCIEGEERLLVYEYMPKKSLDAYLFDPLKQKILDWKTRLNIMEGICRGLLYLHRDSRLRIIHRDLKASNILLDDNLNPKISDFGLARVFRANEDEANTRRVVGTYGYMSPEYAMEGLFSEKSDVFSLGVILLEIISGRRNSHKEENHPNLLAYVWTLWNEGEAASLADPNVFDESFVEEITNCVQIGLLCVQEVANDRPNVSTVIWMLTTENVNLPEPSQPG